MSLRAVLLFALLTNCSSDSSGDTNGTSCKAMNGATGNPSGCICGDPLHYSSEADFGKACNPSNVGPRSVCCEFKDSCMCERVRCGPSKVNGNCVCGVWLGIQYEVASCTGSAAHCCQQETTGYCYCRDTPCGFGSFPVAECGLDNGILRCDYDEPSVPSCG